MFLKTLSLNRDTGMFLPVGQLQAIQAVDAYVYIESYCDNTLLSKVKVDSFTADAAQEVALPFGETINGTKYNVIIKTYAGDGGHAKLNGLCVLKRRVVDFAKNLIF